MNETLLSIVGGGTVAAFLTIFFNVYWDTKKERSSQDWEFKRYRANLVHTATFGLMETFFAAKTEIEYLVGTLSSLEAALSGLMLNTITTTRQHGGPHLTVDELNRIVDEQMQGYRNYTKQQIDIRWNQYEQKMKDLQARSLGYLSVLKPLVQLALYGHILALVTELSTPYPWTL